MTTIKNLKFDGAPAWNPEDCLNLIDQGSNTFVYTHEDYKLTYKFNENFTKCNITNVNVHTKYMMSPLDVDVDIIEME